jgi:hypothetical protein
MSEEVPPYESRYGLFWAGDYRVTLTIDPLDLKDAGQLLNDVARQGAGTRPVISRRFGGPGVDVTLVLGAPDAAAAVFAAVRLVERALGGLPAARIVGVETAPVVGVGRRAEPLVTRETPAPLRLPRPRPASALPFTQSGRLSVGSSPAPPSTRPAGSTPCVLVLQAPQRPREHTPARSSAGRSRASTAPRPGIGVGQPVVPEAHDLNRCVTKGS